MSLYYSSTAQDRKNQAASAIRSLPHARISAWCIQHLTNAQRLVLEGILCELALGEHTIATSAQIAHWANVSEATVSRALPGLAAKGLIRLSRVHVAQTNRTRWLLTPLPPLPDGTYQPRPAAEQDGSDMDASLGSLWPDPTPRAPAYLPTTGDSGVQMPPEEPPQDSASECVGSMSDPSILIKTHDSSQLASLAEPRAPDQLPPGQPAAGPVDSPPAAPDIAPITAKELSARGVFDTTARDILEKHPTLTPAAFDAMLTQIQRERSSRHPIAYLCSILKTGKRPEIAIVPPQPRRVSNLLILTASGIPPETRYLWNSRFNTASTPAQKEAILEAFRRELLSKEGAPC